MGNIISSHNIIAGRKARRLTVLLGSAAVCGLFPASAFAQCAPTSPSDYVCEGANAAGQVVTGPVSNVTTAPGFSVNVAGADALSITSTNGAASYIDENASSLTATGAGSAIKVNATNGNIIVQTGGVLTAGLDAVAVTQSGAGTITLDISGATTSGTGEGVVVRSAGLGGDIRVTTGAVTALAGGRDGVDVQTQSVTADVTVVANGDIAAGNAGIVAAIFQGGALGNIDVTANGAIDARFGIDAENFGAGSTAVTAIGPVNVNSFGIFALSTGGAVAVTAGDVTSINNSAITAQNTGAAGVGAVDVTVGNVSGATGILALNNGAGSIGITAKGTVTGTLAEGISATGNGAVSANVADIVTGTTRGLTLVGGTGGTGDISVVGAGGFVGGTGDAANILDNGNGNVIVNISGASSSAGGHGIFVRDTALGGDISVTTGAVTALAAGKNAIDVQGNAATGDLTVVANGDLQAGDNGISALIGFGGIGDVDVTANGAINAQAGVVAANVGAGSVRVTTVGPVNVTGTGIAASTAIGGGDVTVIAGDITSTTGTGVFAQTLVFGVDSAIEVTVGNVSGVSGLFVSNQGNGTTNIVANGTVTATAGQGIDVTASGAVNVSVADSVRGTTRGLTLVGGDRGTGDISVTGAGGFVGGTGDAANILLNGTGAITVDIAGATSSTGGSGMVVQNTALGGNISVKTGAVTGTTAGINVDNRGIGNTTVTSTGDLIATAGDGLRVAGSASTVDMTVNTLNSSGTVAGIDVRAIGSGDTVVNSVGTATGGTLAGVSVVNGVTSGDITVNAHHATGAVGVQVLGDGIGATVVNVTGNTSGTINDGIFARNLQAASTDLTVVNGGTATGVRFGIVAVNLGSGVTSIASTGDAIGGSDVDEAGIFAVIGEAANDIIINATNATGFRGIDTENRGVGTSSVVATGNVTGIAEGIFSEAQATAGDISISAHNVAGGTAGIGIDNVGTGVAVVNISGVVQGGTAAISAISSDAQALTVNNNGTLRNASGLSSDSAILVNGGPLLLNNNGALLGTLTLFGAVEDEDDDDDDNGPLGAAGTGAARALGFSTLAAGEGLAVGEDDVVNNLVTWNSIGGTSDFGVGDDQLNNRATGRIIAAVAAGLAETTTYVNLENFSNAGVIALNDGGTGDQLVTDGSAVMESGSTLLIDIGAGNTTDILTVGGSATIQAGANLAINPLAPGALGDVHTFLTAADGITGTFTLTNNLVTLFKGYRLGYTANSAFVEFAQVRALAAAGVTPNQIAAATGADSLAFSNPIKAAALNFTSDLQAQAAFDALSGEIHPTVRTVMAEDSRLPRNAVLERLGANRTATVWGQAFGNWGDSDGNRNAASADRDSYGFLAGADFGGSEEGGLIAGGVVGYIDTDVAVRDRASKASVKTLHGLLYAGIRAGGFSFKAGAGYARADVDTQRSVVFTGFADSLTDGYKGAVLQGFAEAGYRVPLGEGYAEPYVGLTAIRAHSNAVAESGGAAAINAASTNEKSLMTTAGIRFSTGVSGTLAVTGNVGWQHAFGGLDPVNIHTLVGSVPFRIEGTAQSRDAGILGIALRYSISPGAEFELGYDGVLGTAAQDHAAKASLRIRF